MYHVVCVNGKIEYLREGYWINLVNESHIMILALHVVSHWVQI